MQKGVFGEGFRTGKTPMFYPNKEEYKDAI
jgi:hypothetical protein